MITKERLQELIEQNATIYFLAPTNEIIEIHCNNNAFIGCYDNMFHFRNNYYNIDANFTSLFETKEEAEWHKEFGCIERTERLELPTWEEFISGTDCTFIIDAIRYRLYIDIDPVEKVEDKIFIEKIYTRQDIYGTRIDWDFLFHKPVTKENYTLACRKAKELFLGEKK